MAWPEEAIPLCERISSDRDRLEDLFNVCLAEGIAGQNYDLIGILWPSIKAKANRIKETCREILRLLPQPRRGRLPKWVTVTEDVIALALGILRCIEYLEEFLVETRWINAQQVLQIGLQHCRAIGDKFDEHPCRNNPVMVPDVYYREFDDVEKL
jgi:hypothetical protein